jgi:hypothetical protein
MEKLQYRSVLVDLWKEGHDLPFCIAVGNHRAQHPPLQAACGPDLLIGEVRKPKDTLVRMIECLR